MPSVALNGGGGVMMVSPGRVALWRGTGSGTATNGFTGPDPSSIAGLSGWWDAGTYAGIVNSNGNSLPGWNNAAGGVEDKSGVNATLAAYSFSGTAPAPQATPRLNGTLGGLGLSTLAPPSLPSPGQLLPVMAADTGLSLGAVAMGSGLSWTLYLVWSRPNYLQGGSVLPAQIALVTLGGQVVLAADSGAVTNPRLILFPGTSSQAVLTTSLTRRHTHSIIIRATQGSGVDVWLDGTPVAAGNLNPLPSSVTGPLLFLHAGTAYASAQCWFHEAAIWDHALASGDITTLLSAATRWTRGTRKGVQVFVIGQSNAINAYGDGAWHLLAQGIAWHLGALAYNVTAGSNTANGAAYTMAGGHGVSNVPFSASNAVAQSTSGDYYGSFLEDPGDGSDPAGWALGADGLAVQAFIQAQNAADLEDVSVIAWPWTETDSVRSYTEKAYYNHAVVNLLARVRAMLGASAAAMPMVIWNAIPIGVGTNGGIQAVRETAYDLSVTSGQNVTIAWAQTCNSNPAGGSWDPATGIFTNVNQTADFDHRDATDLLNFGRIAAPVAARSILASTGGDTMASIPSGIPVVGGPAISHVYQATAHSTTLIVTVTHDAGTDLVLPGQASTGVGWTVIDGGSVASPGPQISVTACTRVDATHLELTLASAPVNAQPGLLLFYPFGFGNIYRGDAVTDNYSTLIPPSGWDIAGDLGSAWSTNYPLAATTYPIPVSATP